MSEPATDVPSEPVDLVGRAVRGAWEGAPTILVLGATRLVGYIASRLLRGLVRRLTDKLGLEVLAEKIGLVRLLYAVGIRQGVASVLGHAAYWAGLLLTGYIALMNLGIEGVNRALEQIGRASCRERV